MREPGAEYKEDWDSGTAAAIAGGFTTILAMPNTNPPIIDEPTLSLSLDKAEEKARCDFGQFLGAGPDNALIASPLSTRSAGLKMYLDMTYGKMRLDNMDLWIPHFQNWPKNRPIAVHAEKYTMAAAILMSALFDQPIHICHVSKKEEIIIIKAAKEKGMKVTCEVTPHHLFLTNEDISTIGPGKSEVRPILANPTDRDALWEFIEVIDCIATDHAPHTIEEKNSDNPPPGFPGLETALPLMLTAIHKKWISLEDTIIKMHENPHKIFNIPKQPDTFVEVDPNTTWKIHGNSLNTKCGWTPFEDMQVQGSINRVVLRGEEVFKDNKVLANPGSGQNIRTI